MVNIDGLESPPNNPYSVHFDLYSYDDAGNKIDYFAPFSHDAQSGGHGLIVHNVPDGGTTLLLLGAAMTCLGIGRRLRLKA
jgi:hypothetical protein